MDGEFDVVVAGAGHNSLTATAYLAKAGLRCLVIEANPEIGGDTSSAELTLPGFIHDSCSTAHNLIQSSPLLRDDELGLAGYGLEYLQPDPVVHIPFPDGSWLTQWRDLDRTCAEFARFSARDAAAYRQMMTGYGEIAAALTRCRYTPAGRYTLAGYGETTEQVLARQPAGSSWLRRDAMSAWDVIRDAFEDPHCRAFMLWMSFMTMRPPDRPGTGLLAYSLAYGRQRHSWTLPRGGSAALPRALARVIEAHHGVLLTGTRVTRLLLSGGRCHGVETETGERYLAARAVLSTIHVKHLAAMAPAAAWGEDFLHRAETWQAGISMFVTHYATTQPPRFPVDGGVAGGGEIAPVASGTPESAERMLRLAADFRAGRVAIDEPVLLVLCPTVADPSRAPAGHHTLKVVGFQPYELPAGPDRWDAIRDTVSAANLAQLRRYAPGVTDDTILATEVKSPLDLERMNAHNWHGSCHGGDSGPAQPGPRHWADLRTPIPGLYQTGATTCPGGSVSAAPGRNAAAVMLEDLGSSLAEAVSRRG